MTHLVFCEWLNQECHGGVDI